MSKMETLGYQDNEVCLALIDGNWHNAVVVERKGSTIYSLMFPDEREMETGVDKFRDVPLKKMARAQVYVCRSCGNWVDPDDAPVLGFIEGSKADISLAVELHCPHADIPWMMQRVPWNEVPGVTAIGGIHAVS